MSICSNCSLIRSLLVACLAAGTVFHAVEARATVTGLTNGDFEVAGAGLAGTAGHVGAPWFQLVAAGGNYSEWTAQASIVTGGSGNALAFSNLGGSIYQQIGTVDGNELSAVLTGVNVQRGTDLGGALTFSIYQTPSTTVGANGTFVSALAGAILVDSDTIPDDLAGGTPINLSFDLTSLVAGNKVWFGVQDNLASNNETFADTLALTITTAAPEPSTLILAAFGLVGLAFGGRRRKRS